MKEKVLIIIGSATNDSTNLQIAKLIKDKLGGYEVEIINNLETLPHFQTALTELNTPFKIVKIRQKIEQARGVIFSTPEYVFSIPSRLKNLLEWCVSTTVFSDKPIAIVTASTSGINGHEELQLIMKTLGAVYDDKTLFLLQGLKGRLMDGKLNDITEEEISKLIDDFILFLSNK